MTLIKGQDITAQDIQNHNHNNTGTIIPIKGGGTGADNIDKARTNLDVPSNAIFAEHDHSDIGSVIPIEGGGTSAITVDDARIKLNAASNTDFINHNHNNIGAVVPPSAGGTGVRTLSELADSMGLGGSKHGTWTPRMTFAGSTTFTYQSISAAYGYYNKIGKRVTAGWRYRITVTDSDSWMSSSRDYVRLDGLPYVVDGDCYVGDTGCVLVPSNTTRTPMIVVGAVNGTNQIFLQRQGGATYYLEPVNHGGLMYLDGSIVYFTY